MPAQDPAIGLSTTMTLESNLTVGRLGFGAMRITGRGIWGPPPDEAAAIALLRRVVDKRVTFIDTADSYGPGVSETLIAKALCPCPAGLVIASKGGLTRPGPGCRDVDCRPEHLRLQTLVIAKWQVLGPPLLGERVLRRSSIDALSRVGAESDPAEVVPVPRMPLWRIALKALVDALPFRSQIGFAHSGNNAQP